MKKILFITGSPNQTSQMHQVATHLMADYDCWFSQIFPNYLSERLVLKTGIMDSMVISDPFRKRSEQYMIENGLRNDYMGKLNRYDMVVLSTDMIVPFRLRYAKTVWVQEGMTDQPTWRTWVTKIFGLPRYACMDTSLNGASNICDIYCAASQGYLDHFVDMGTQRDKIIVTGIPNFDNVAENLVNDFPHRDYVLVATSDVRECYRIDDRPAFLRRCKEIAAGRQLIFKLHPNEKIDRAKREIYEIIGLETLIFSDGNPNHMIANCEELITQYSTLVYVGIILGKKVHSWFDLNELYQKVPIQTGGTSARQIAEICRGYAEFNGTGIEFLRSTTKPSAEAILAA